MTDHKKAIRQRGIEEQLRSLSDEDIRRLMRLSGSRRSHERKPAAGKRWFEQKLCGLTRDAQKHLRETRKLLDSPLTAPHADKKWLRYAETFRKMPFRVPDFYREDIDARQLYRRLQRFCHDNNLPDEIVVSVVPELVHYIRSGRMRPIIFVGERGSGKTTAVRMLMKEALGIPVETIKVPEADRGHGLTGDSGTYKSSDLGFLAKAQLRNNSLIIGYIIDEVDKVPHNASSSSIDDELLSVTDDSVDSIEDKYLESTLVSLPYCPIFMTGNDLSQINPILADRCKVIHYPSATPERIKAIMHKYVDRKLQEDTYTMIDFDFGLLNSSIDKLVRRSVSSLRRHQDLIETVLNKAFTQAMRTDAERVAVTAEMFEEAEQQILSAAGRRIGFSA